MYSCLTLPFREGGSGLISMEQNSPIVHCASVVGTYQTVGTVFPAVQEASKATKEAIIGVFAECIEADIPLSAASEDGGEGADESQGEREQTLRAAQYAAELVPLISKLKGAWTKFSSKSGRLSPGWAETEIAIGPRGHEKGVDEEAQGDS